MLSIRREDLEAREHQILSPEAAFSDQSKGRAIAEEPDQYRTCYQCDRDRILHSKSFRIHSPIQANGVRKRLLANVTKRRMAQVMTKRNCLGKIFV